MLNIGINLDAKFHFKQSILNFMTKFAQKGYFRSKMKKVNITIQFAIFELISLTTKFQLKLTILLAWTKFAQGEFFRSKIDKVKITIEFYILELV